MSEKQKLTLSVNKEVVEKAKEMGINISEITENVLRGFAFSPTELDDAEVYKQYEELFSIMLPTMKKYNFVVRVASEPILDTDDNYIDTLSIILHKTSTFWVDEFDHSFSDINQIKISDFLPPLDILSRFIEKLTNSFQTRKEHLRELEMVKQIIQAISGSLPPNERNINRNDR